MTDSTTPKTPPPLLTTHQVAEWLQVDRDTLEVWRARGVGPRCSKLTDGPTSPVRYARQDVEEWLAEREIRRCRK